MYELTEDDKVIFSAAFLDLEAACGILALANIERDSSDKDIRFACGAAYDHLETLLTGIFDRLNDLDRFLVGPSQS